MTTFITEDRLKEIEATVSAASSVAIAQTLERCIQIAEGPVFGSEGATPEGIEIARLIREFRDTLSSD